MVIGEVAFEDQDLLARPNIMPDQVCIWRQSLETDQFAFRLIEEHHMRETRAMVRLPIRYGCVDDDALHLRLVHLSKFHEDDASGARMGRVAAAGRISDISPFRIVVVFVGEDTL
jgi:hypothetical protein